MQSIEEEEKKESENVSIPQKEQKAYRSDSIPLLLLYS